MNWEIIGATGEWAGAVAVVVTLVYLARQIRLNTNAMKQQGHSSILTRRQDILTHYLDSPEFIQLWSKVAAEQPLDPIEAQRFSSYCITFLTHVQDAYLQHEAGTIDKSIWEAELRLAAPLFTATRLSQLVGTWPAISHTRILQSA